MHCCGPVCKRATLLLFVIQLALCQLLGHVLHHVQATDLAAACIQQAVAPPPVATLWSCGLSLSGTFGCSSKHLLLTLVCP